MEESLNQLLQDLGLDDSDSGEDAPPPVSRAIATNQNHHSRPVVQPQRPPMTLPRALQPTAPYTPQQQQQSPVGEGMTTSIRALASMIPALVTRQFQEEPGAEQFRRRDPIYDFTSSISGAGEDGIVIDKHGPLRLPPARLRGLGSASPDFVRILKSLELGDPRDEEVRRGLPLLSQEFARLRATLKEQSQRCDIDTTYFAYLIVLKRLARFFETADCAFDSYFPACCNSQSTHFIYEYMQALLMTGARLYEQGTRKLSSAVPTGSNIDKDCAEDFLLAQYVYDELRRTAEYCQGDKLLQSGKWLYVASPDAIGSNSFGGSGGAGLYNMRLSQQQATVQRERATLRNFIRYDLHGLEALELRALLCRAKLTEAGVALMQHQLNAFSTTGGANSTDSEATVTEQKCAKVYEKLAPLMLCCKQHYDSIVQQLRKQQEQSALESDGTPALLNYAQYHSYYWYLQQELGQARAEWACFGDPTALDFDLYGRRAVRRLCVLRDSLAQKEAWVQALGPDPVLQRDWDATKRTVLALHDEVKRGVVDSVWQQGSQPATAIPEIQAYKAPADTSAALLGVYSEKWAQLQQLPQYQPLLAVFDFLERLSTAPNPGDVMTAGAAFGGGNTKQQAPPSISMRQQQAPPSPQVSPGGDALENQRILGLVEERVNHLDWLVGQIDDDGDDAGTLYIDQEGCDYLRRQLELTHQFIAKHNLVFSTTTRK